MVPKGEMGSWSNSSSSIRSVELFMSDHGMIMAGSHWTSAAGTLGQSNLEIELLQGGKCQRGEQSPKVCSDAPSIPLWSNATNTNVSRLVNFRANNHISELRTR